MALEDILNEAAELLKKFEGADLKGPKDIRSQLLQEGIDFFKQTRHAVVVLELTSEDEFGNCSSTLLDLFEEVVRKCGLDFQETSGSLKIFLYGLQTLCNITTKFTAYRDKFSDKFFQKSEVIRLLETSLRHLSIEDASKMVVVQIVLLNNLILAALPERIRFLNSAKSQHVILNLIKAYPAMQSETQSLCDGLIKNLVEVGFCEVIFTELSPNKGLMSELQFEMLEILCHSKAVHETSKFYDMSVNLFPETVELINTLTQNIKQAESVSSELECAVKTVHDQLKVWMEWFYLASDPEAVRSKSDLNRSASSRLLQAILRLLQILEDNVPKVITIKDSKNFTPSHLTMTTAKTWVMRVINNLIYDNFELQDKVRELNYLPLILNQCNIDDNNPYLRELGIFAVRNLTSHNPENAALVKALSPQGAAPSPVLEELGLETTTDSNGIPRIIQKNRS
ncbi:Ataxin-10 [Entomophthora muscae]|uniref:Ataxin-10 n=2 Tax=Entomophthora muscae TaxID=34485 RepID=A0ACC2SC73_9FUNG|nr:Ataxin-10 [Entomophthora muscae]